MDGVWLVVHGGVGLRIILQDGNRLRRSSGKNALCWMVELYFAGFVS